MIDLKQINTWNPPLPPQTDRGVFNYMSTPTVYGLLRQLCEETGGPYLEIGSYRGMGLVACSEICHATGIDNFTGVAQRLGAQHKAMLLSQIDGRAATLLEGDYQEVTAGLEAAKEKFSVIFIDGPHEKGDTAKQLQAVKKLIKKGGYIVVDDYNAPGIQDETREFVEKTRGFEIVFEKETARRTDKTWWNGICVIWKK